MRRLLQLAHRQAPEREDGRRLERVRRDAVAQRLHRVEPALGREDVAAPVDARRGLRLAPRVGAASLAPRHLQLVESQVRRAGGDCGMRRYVGLTPRGDASRRGSMQQGLCSSNEACGD